MRRHLKNYKCPRCGYETSHKTNMKNHFYKTKKTCPAIESDIDLTNEIKDYVLINRSYKIEKEIVPASTSSVNHFHQTINNYNTLNNFLCKMDPMEKLMQFTNYKNIELIGLEEKIEDKYGKRIKKLETNDYKYGFEMKTHDLLETINEISRVCNCKTLDEFNILYDSRFNKIKIYDGEWEELLSNTGVKKLIEIVQLCYWYAYECYLIRKIVLERSNTSRELLDEYFKFIGCFDVKPYLKGRNNNMILYNIDDERYDEEVDSIKGYTISDEFMSRYNTIHDNITKSEINNFKKNVLEIIKINSLKNVDELNKRIMELFYIDEQFKNQMMSNILPPSQ